MDCDDSDCANSIAEPLVQKTVDGVDDDGDGDVDCDDSVGDHLSNVLYRSRLREWSDDDMDGDVDCADTDCAGRSHSGAIRRARNILYDNQDNDGDGDVDCADMVVLELNLVHSVVRF